jgi:lipoyl-dependent peroxiredoxin
MFLHDIGFCAAGRVLFGFGDRGQGFRMTVQGQNLDEATFARMVGDAEKSCPVSRVLNAAITLGAKLT